MNVLIGYGILALFFLFIVYILERSNKASHNFTDYAVAGRSFGSWFQAMSFINTWLPGTVFVAFVGLAAGSGVIGFYLTSYSLLAVFLMFVIAQPVFEWGHRFDLRTQADFVGMRYDSTPVRVVAAIIGVVSIFPWLILAFQSVGLLFYYLSYETITTTEAVFIGIGVLAIRQIWTIRMGVRGIIISDMAQGIVAYGGGGLIALGILIWLLNTGHGFDQLPPAFATLPGVGSDLGSLYYFSIIFTGAFGALCWPDMFVRLFTGSSTRVIKHSAQLAAIMMLLFTVILLVMGMLASSLPGVADAPDNVWFIAAKAGGPVLLALAGTAVFAAAMGNTNALAAAIGTHAAQDIIHVKGAPDQRVTRTAKIVIAVATILAAVGAVITVKWTSGLFTLAVVAYQGIVQLAPALYLGIFWKRGNAVGAVSGMIVGFIVAIVLQVLYPVSIPWLWGVTSGVAGMVVNLVVYVAMAYLVPMSTAEKHRIDDLFAGLGRRDTEAGPVVSSSH